MGKQYIFQYRIIDEETEAVKVAGSTYLSQDIGESGENENESVDMEIGRAIRILNRIKNNQI